MSCFEMLKLIQVTGSSLLVGPASVAVSAAATTVAALAVGIVPGQVRPRKMAPTLMICWSLYHLPGNFDFHILPVRRYLRYLMKPGAIRHLNLKLSETTLKLGIVRASKMSLPKLGVGTCCCCSSCCFAFWIRSSSRSRFCSSCCLGSRHRFVSRISIDSNLCLAFQECSSRMDEHESNATTISPIYSVGHLDSIHCQSRQRRPGNFSAFFRVSTSCGWHVVWRNRNTSHCLQESHCTYLVRQ